MGDEEEKTTVELLKEMQRQMVSLQSKVDEMQQKQHPTAVDHEAIEDEDGSGNLVELSETTKSFLEAAFSATVANTDRKKRLDRIGVPDCDAIRCPKLDQVMRSIIPNDATKADGYLSRLQQFWLDAVTPLTALLETAEGGELKSEDTVAAVQSALYFLGNAHQHMNQERRKKVLMNLNPALKSMANDEKIFKAAAPMLFGDEFAAKATDRVEQLKAITKVTTKPEQKKSASRFFGYHPRNYSSNGRGGGSRNGRGRYQPYQRNNRPGPSNQGQKN